MARLKLECSVIDADVYGRTLARFRQAGVVLPTIGQLKDPCTAAFNARSGAAAMLVL